MPSRVLLVNPNRMKPAVAPIGLDYIAESLQRAGHDVYLVDLCFAQDGGAVEEAVRTANPDVVGVTIRNTDDCYFASKAFFLDDIRSLIGRLQHCTSAHIVLGGVGFSIMPEPILRYCGASLGIAGDGEEAFPALATRLERGEDFDDLPGLVWQRPDGAVHNGRAMANLASSTRARRFVDNPRYFEEGGQGGIETKRGCHSSCIYCADPVAKGRAARLRPPALVADEVEALLAQGVDYLHMCDPEFNVPYDHAAAVCRELIERGLGERVHWYTYAAPAPFSQELADLMRRAGCAGINFGADSAVDAQLRRLGRAFTADDVEAAVRYARSANMAVMVDLLIGGPGESPETVRQTIDAMRRLTPDAVGAAVGTRVYPDTALARQIQQEGFTPANRNLHGAVEGNEDMLRPVFYVSSLLGNDPVGRVNDLIGGDPRFFTGEKDAGDTSYNYNDNSVLVQAIRHGQRGAYWHILTHIDSLTAHVSQE